MGWMYKYCSNVLRMTIMAAVVVVTFACGKENEPSASVAASIKYDLVDCETITDQLLLSGSDDLRFTATIVEGSEWLSFAPNTTEILRTGAIVPVVFLYLQRNTTPDDRTAVVKVEFSGGQQFTLPLTQQRFSSSATFDRAWAEQPQYKSGTSLLYKTYFTTLANAKYVRSYSICYDVDKKVAHWVAYPLHVSYTSPNVGRTDAWAYDPNTQPPTIPDADQQYVVESYKTGYARGHQCPSADRYSTIPTNKQTFYATNLMPQNSSFNGGVWSTLENKIRENVVSDTLYVVTGTFFANARTTTDRRGNKIGLPSNCWKVLMRTKKGNTGKPIQECSAEELIGIGFWFANDESNSSLLPQHARSIADIEELTGFTFFRNLPANATESVKAQNTPSDWKIR